MACDQNKTNYRSEAAATRAMERLQVTSPRERVPQRVYFCQPCWAFHLTSWPAVKPCQPCFFDMHELCEGRCACEHEAVTA